MVEVTDAKVTGDRVSGRLEGSAAADWLVVNGTVGTLDVRATMRTDDGAVVLTQYLRRMDVTNGPGSAPIYVAPPFEAGDERHAWLDAIQAVGKGTLEGNRILYEWYEVR